MEYIENKKDLGDYLAWQKKQTTKKLSLVPTMGCLHAGHEKLLGQAKALGLSAVSIFVNPLQFNDPQDYTNYPQDREKDLAICKEQGVDLVFAPSSPEEIYAREPLLKLSMPALTQGLCGADRPGHFEGVMQVILRFFHLFSPDFAIFGKKDYQQYLIIKRMVEDLDLEVKIIGVETVRDQDGLALSSRNVHLHADARQHANLLYRGLKIGSNAYNDGEDNPKEIQDIVKDVILSGIHNRIEYVEVVDQTSLEPLKKLDKESNFLLAVAIICAQTRLIDNLECGLRK